MKKYSILFSLKNRQIRQRGPGDVAIIDYLEG